GFTSSTDFPTTVGTFQRTYGGGKTDNFVTKLNLSGTGLVYSTYLGGNGDEQPRDLAVDQEGNVYVPGLTSSTNFPTTHGAFQTTYAGGASDGYLTKLNASGSRLVYSTYLGGSGDDIAGAVRVDRFGNAYVPGQTSSTNFPTTANALQSTYGGGASDAFVAKLNSIGSRLVFSTYLGGSGDDGSNGSGVGIDQGCNRVDGSNGQGNGGNRSCNVFVNGFTNSVNFPTTAGRSSTLWREASMSSVSS
ncbi:MAG TPA: SBBP repeat-containing protein, partial [Ktedonobacteraceae bacterium]|nr:SBBP repeat-containing protein [Ktedonobacteraceae bacterium]